MRALRQESWKNKDVLSLKKYPKNIPTAQLENIYKYSMEKTIFQHSISRSEHYAVNEISIHVLEWLMADILFG